MKNLIDIAWDLLTSDCQRYINSGNCCYRFMEGKLRPCVVCRAKKKEQVICKTCTMKH